MRRAVAPNDYGFFITIALLLTAPSASLAQPQRLAAVAATP
jgi:hypothetical protein